MQGNAVRAIRVVAAALFVSMALAPAALADPPANDERANAQLIELGDRVNGTTVEATTSEDDASGCGPSDTPSVWYRLEANADGRAIAQLQAAGDLDVVLDVYQRQRSQFSSVTCEFSDERGQASAEWRIRRGQSFLIRVSQQQNSVSGDFTLLVDLGQPAATAPGRPLPREGGTGTVQRIFEPSNAWSTELREGETYRINLSPESCMQLSIYGPGTRSFEDESPVRTRRCGGYTLFTPGPRQGGRYSFLIQPNSSRRTAQSYRLQVARAGRDDTTPGRFVRNHAFTRGALDADRIDVVDLYRFDVLRKSTTDLQLNGPDAQDFDIVLVAAKGKRIRCGCGATGNEEVRVQTKRGRYFVAVIARRHAKGNYRLTRRSKTITRTRLSIAPSRTAPGRNVNLRVAIAPPEVSGPVTIVVERFDPLEGYQLIRRFETRAVRGRASVSFLPPSVGRYRARATFNATRIAAGSQSAFRNFRVEEPLTE
jgi:hypothetical protein